MKKKLLSVILAAAMLAPCVIMPATAYAAIKEAAVTQPSGDYAAVLEAVKKKVVIPDDVTKFDFYMDEDEDRGKQYVFEWRNDESENKYIFYTVSADEKGNITGYHFYSNDRDYKNGVVIRDLSKDEIKEKLESQIKAIVPEKFDKLELRHFEVNSNSVSAIYARVENGIKVFNDCVQVSADIKDSEVILNSLYADWHDVEFAVPENTITREAAEAAYKKESGFFMNYSLKYEKRDNYSAFLRYSIRENAFIDAVTGEKVEPEDNNYIYQNSMKEEATADTAGGYRGLSSIEIAEFESIGNMMSYESAESKARAIKELNIDSGMTLASKSIKKINDEYILSLRFESEKKNCEVRINAANGDIYGAWQWSKEDEKYDETYKADEAAKNNAKAKAEEFVKNYIPVYGTETRFANIDANGMYAEIKLDRLINGIPCEENGINISWDMKNDCLASVNVSKENITSAPMPENTINIDEAYAIVAPKLEKLYLIKDKKAVLTYGLLDIENAYIDAVTGKKISYNGKVEESFGGYTDISGHWAEEIINTLAEYDVRINSDKFMPDEPINQKNFLNMLYTANMSHTAEDEETLYNYFIRNKIISSEERNPEGVVTKQQAVKYMLDNDYGKTAKIRNIFECEFNDRASISEEYFGYVAIAKGLGIVKGDENNNFNPEKNITNAEAASLIYNYIKLK